MRLTVKNYFFFYLVVDENNFVVAKIKNSCFLGAAKKILNSTGEVVYITDILNLSISHEAWNYAESRCYVMYKGPQKVANATFNYAKNTKRTIPQRFMFRSPQIDEIHIETIYGDFNIRRQRDNSLTIHEKNKLIGNISQFFALKRHIISCDKIQDTTFLVGLYVLVIYMMNEDDLIIV